MSKENVISHGATAIVGIVLGAVSLHFVSGEYTLGIGYLLGVGHAFLKPHVEKVLFKR